MRDLTQTLAQLRDIQPGPPPTLPTPTPWGWYLTLLLLGAGLTLCLWRCAPLVRAGWQLYRLRHMPSSATAATSFPGEIPALNRWLKATALLIAPRQEVAALSGDAWLTWLAQQGKSPWHTVAARWSAWLYAGQTCSAEEYRQVWCCCRRWWLTLLWRRLCWH